MPYHHVTEHFSRMDIVFGGPQFKSRPGFLLTWWFSCFSRLSTQMSSRHCKHGH